MLAALALLSLLAADVSAQPRPTASWRVAPTPELSIGGREGDPAHLLEEVTGILRLRDGRLVIADGQSQRLRVYDDTGRHLHDWGREGSGPGEFGYLRAVVRYRGDSIAAYDARGRRITIFDDRGRVGRSLRVVLTAQPSAGRFPASSHPELAGTFDDGSFLMVLPEMMPVSGSGTVWGTVTLGVLSADGEPVATIGPVRGSEYWIDGDLPGRPMRVLGGPRFIVAVHANGFVHGTGETPELEVRDTRGRLVRTLRVGAPRQPVAADMRRRLEAEASSRYAASPEGIPAAALRRSITKSLPAFDRVLVDMEGRIWVGRTRRPGDDAGGSSFTVFDLEGRVSGSVSAVPDLDVRWIEGRLILGVWRDALDVPHVLGFRVER